jgi:type IV fimbrial biogenesis protein FimT
MHDLILGMNMRNRATGFTLIEMMVTVSILSILMVMAIQSYQSTTNGTRISSEINSLQSALNLARSEALKRGLGISVCPAANATAATAVCDGGTNWSNGWVILVGSTAATTVAPPLFISPGVTHNDTLTSHSTATPPYPTFTPAGYTFFGQSAGDTISLHDANSTQSLYRCIAFSAGTWQILTGASCP